jgi:hypothetical protein
LTCSISVPSAVVVLGADERDALDQPADAVAHLDGVAAHHHLELQVVAT